MDINVSQWKWLMRLWLLVPTYILLQLISVMEVNAQPMTFHSGSTRLSGEYLAPLHNQPAKAVLVFVHGDGEQTYNADGYYDLIWHQLRAQGYAVLSWDKPGVGDSSGNWLAQSMIDRQEEVLAAVDWVQQAHGFTASNTGSIGFSQAGWVVPAVANHNSKVGFTIGVGFATNWIDQGRYYTRIKHQLAGGNSEAIQAAIAKYDDEVNFLKSARPSDYPRDSSLSRQRFEFIIKNIASDASSAYPKINVPTLLLWGKDDLNVDAKLEFMRWQQQPMPDVTTFLLAGANHGLLDSARFNRQHYGIKDWLMLAWLEDDALAKDFMPTLLDWLAQLPLQQPKI